MPQDQKDNFDLNHQITAVVEALHEFQVASFAHRYFEPLNPENTTTPELRTLLIGNEGATIPLLNLFPPREMYIDSVDISYVVPPNADGTPIEVKTIPSDGRDIRVTWAYKTRLHPSLV
jgi:hypothetical protein